MRLRKTEMTRLGQGTPRNRWGAGPVWNAAGVRKEKGERSGTRICLRKDLGLEPEGPRTPPCS